MNAMKEHLKVFDAELDGIKLVLDKLVTKQNSSVFDKLCGKCNDLFADFNSKVTVEKAIAESSVSECIQFLKRLLDVCKKLQDYKMYLIEVITQNIGEYQRQVAQVTEQTVVSEVAPVSLDEVNNVVKFDKPKTLDLTNQETRNAA